MPTRGRFPSKGKIYRAVRVSQDEDSVYLEWRYTKEGVQASIRTDKQDQFKKWRGMYPTRLKEPMPFDKAFAWVVEEEIIYK